MPSTRPAAPAALFTALALWNLSPAAGGARAAEPGADAPLPVDAAVLARAWGIMALPCAGDTTVDGFAPDEAAPPAWRIGGALVSVRRRQGDRLAFVLAPPAAGAAGAADPTECTVRDVVVLPRGGTLLACSLQDDSVQGLGVHTLLPGGRRDLLFWRVDARGALRRQGASPGDRDFESDTGELICALPGPIR